VRLEKVLQTDSVTFFILRSVLNNLELRNKEIFQFAKEFCEIIEDNQICGNIIDKYTGLLGKSINNYNDFQYLLHNCITLFVIPYIL
jgi:phosphatidylinositol kinase/protein kinase (PI-3  family)